MTDLPGGMPPRDRDLAGYGRNPPIRMAGGRRASPSPSSSMSRRARSCPSPWGTNERSAAGDRQRVEAARDPCMESHFAYGTRAGCGG